MAVRLPKQPGSRAPLGPPALRRTPCLPDFPSGNDILGGRIGFGEPSGAAGGGSSGTAIHGDEATAARGLILIAGLPPPELPTVSNWPC